MKITFDTNNEQEVAEVVELLDAIGAIDTAEDNTEAPQEPKKVSEGVDKAEVEKEPQKPKKESPKSTIKLADLKDAAAKAVERLGNGSEHREKVKSVIGEFAPKLAEVAEADFGKLYKKLQEL